MDTYRLPVTLLFALAAKLSARPSQMQVDYAANLAFFLLEKVGTVLGNWQGRMPSSQQKALFGRYLGKGQIVIDGSTETLCNRVKVCFGLDYDDRNIISWANL